MRLLTHNMLQCHAKGCDTNNFPLAISNAEVEQIDADFNEHFIERLLLKVDWPALHSTCHSLGISIPESCPEEHNQEFLQSVHHVLLETRIKNGELKCANCSHVYGIKDSIANMLLQEHEV